MKWICKPIICYALSVSIVAAYGAPTQSTGVTKKRVSADSDARELNGLLTAAQEAVSRKDYSAAAQNYQDYLSKKPDDASVHYNLGYVYTALQRSTDARNEYEKAIALDPKMTSAYLNLGLTLLPTDPSAAIEPLRQAAELSPQDVRPKWLLGTAFERSGKLDSAIEEYQAAEKIDPRDFDTHISLGQTLLKANRAADAESEFRAAIELRSGGGSAHLGLARSLAAQKQIEPAAAALAAYLQTQPDDAAARAEHAFLLVDLGKEDEALAELDMAAKARPEGLAALKLRSSIYWKMKHYDDAVPVLQKAATIAPQDPDIAARLGEVYFQKRDYANAVTWLTSAYGLNPGANDLLIDLAVAEYSTKNYAATLAAIEMLSKTAPLAPASVYIRASCYDNLGHPKEALDEYKKFLDLNKDQNSDMYFASTARVRELTRELKDKR